MRISTKVFVALSALALSSPVLASSGGGFGGGNNVSGQRVDTLYEEGRALFRASQVNGTKLEYCVKDGNQLKKLSRRSVRDFKRGPASEFVGSLYSCANPELTIAELVTEEDGSKILHYLNKRFKLRLAEG